MKHEGELGKTECWYIISAEEGSKLFMDIMQNHVKLPEMINSGGGITYRKLKLKQVISSHTCRTMHAIGAGIILKHNNQTTQLTVYMISIAKMTKVIFVNYTYNNQLMLPYSGRSNTRK